MSKNQAAPAPELDAGTLATIREWQDISRWLGEAKTKEMELRKKLTAFFFPSPTEGANRVEGEGIEVVLTHKINRTLDVAVLDSVMPQLPEDFHIHGVLVEYKPQLCLKGFRLLEAMPEHLKTFQQALIEKPGAPELVINLNIDNAALDPASAPATPDWPAQESTAHTLESSHQPTELPITTAYEAEKARHSAKMAAKTARGVAVKTQKAKSAKKVKR